MDVPSSHYPIIHVPRDASEETEHVGTKEKFWFFRSRPGPIGQAEDEEEWMFKAVRKRKTGSLAGTYPDGDDWAERVAADVAGRLGLPHAAYEMAVYDGEDGPVPGIITRKIQGPGRLVEGNELLVEHARIDGYPRAPRDEERKFTRVTAYSPPLVLDTLMALGVEPPPASDLPPAVQTGADLLVGYLLLDALVWNTDRHDQNWAVFENSRQLAPTYDHASCLGRELPDTKRSRRLSSHHVGQDLAAYRDHPGSRFHDEDGNPVNPLGAFRIAAHRRPLAAASWIDRLDRCSQVDVEAFLARIPDHRIRPIGREFAARLVESNRADLQALRASLP